jgi:hypothetical protein
MWQLVHGEPDSMDAEEISRHPTKQEAEDAKAALDQRGAEAP